MADTDFKTAFKANVFEWLNVDCATPEDFADDEPLFGEKSRLGLDSLDAVELVVMLQRHYGVPQKDFENKKELFKNIETLADYVQNHATKGL
ncbi:MAG: phosphopantetheine-binding protein [Lentisphaeria bacterium]|nr:phosphopantetheine-binding protein [Lentisphaeria bacterium]